MDAKKTAVVFIEFQNDFCTEGGKLYSLVGEEIKRNQTIENAVKLLQGAREKGVTVIHCPFVLDKPWIEENGLDGLLKNLAAGDVFASESWGGAIIDQMKPLENEYVLTGKHALSGFEHTQLDKILTDNGIENVGVVGFLTNLCAQATAWGAYDRGYRTRMIPSACGAASQAIQEFVEKEICPVFGGVPTVDEFLAEIE